MSKKQVYIIAEAGVNHNGSLKLAQQLVREGAATGVNAVKFQTFRPEKLVTNVVEKAVYQKENTGNQEGQLEMLQRLTLKDEDFIELENLCHECGIDFISTPFDSDSLNFLTNDIDMPFIKIPSGEITNAPFLWEIAQTQKPVVLSTGMATLGEIENALAVLAHGYLENNFPKSYQTVQDIYVSVKGQDILREKVQLLHCTTQYPASASQANLRVMDTMRNAFGLPVGYSDHTQGLNIPLAAVARGAAIIEKHFTLDRNLPGPDHKASLELGELRAMVQGIREVEEALGNGVKIPAQEELSNIYIARKSLVASRNIYKGEMFSMENVIAKRAGKGISPMNIWHVLGSKAQRDYVMDEKIEW